MFSTNTYNALDIVTLLTWHYGERIVSYSELFDFCFTTKEILNYSLRILEENKIIVQPHGEGNGYSLIRRPDEIKLLEVIEPFDKDIFYDHLFNKDGVKISERARKFYMANRPMQQILLKRLRKQNLSKWCQKATGLPPYGFG